MKSFKFYNNLFAWLSFAIAALTYFATLEPTVSFWDCGEFIASAYKLEVGHPPGAPFFMLLARFFTLFSFGNVESAAMMINGLSALASAFTILFLFWTITHFARKIALMGEDSDEMSLGQQIAVLGSGLVGALSFTFSDTFWFSAVEAEVYATSSLFTAAVFWLILKWETQADEANSNRWIILIAYLMGLSIGVHLLNLLAIPAIVYVYYFKRFKFSWSGFAYAGIIGVLILFGIQYMIIPGVPYLASQFDLLFVNGLGLPFFSGVLFYMVALIGALCFGIWYTLKQEKQVLNLVFTAVAVILIGYSSFSIIVIRSFANPPMNENSPDNMFSLLSYLNREQYGDRPLFYGHYYNAPTERYEKGKAQYARLNGKYVKTGNKTEYVYKSGYKTIFPRMYSSNRTHVSGYRNWAHITRPQNEAPSFAENMMFFFGYQVDHMYIRYLLWNFVGRQNDVQGHGGASKGNWISGFDFLDNLRTLPVDNGPNWLAGNKGRNAYFFLPLLLGLVGLLFLARERKKDFWVLFLFFFFTGVAIIFYLNQPPYQPRERDYAFAGSFYVWGAFIGLGVMALYKNLEKQFKIPAKSVAILVVVFGMVSPVIMAAQNWDDHDRSGRYTARDWAKNYLDSCDPNAILFTYGDNDTFPLWYVQEVEGYRTDVRVVNLSLLGTDWYIDQIKRKAYSSAPVPMVMKREQYIQGTRDVIPLYDRLGRSASLESIMDFVLRDEKEAKLQMQSGEWFNYIPTKGFHLEVDSLKVIKNKTASQIGKRPVVPVLEWRVGNNYFTKSELAILDILATFNWDRPIYFAISIGESNMLGLKDYLRLDGLAYRLVPQKADAGSESLGWIDTDILYDRLMNKFQWGRMAEEDVFIDQQNIRTSKIIGFREVFYRLASELIKEGKKEKAIAVIDKIVELMPHEKFPFEEEMVGLTKLYYMAGDFGKGDQLAEKVWGVAENEINYYIGLSESYGKALEYDKNKALFLLQGLLDVVEKQDRKTLVTKFDAGLEKMLMGN